MVSVTVVTAGAVLGTKFSKLPPVALVIVACGISNHDNCVRLCLELANSTRELIMGQFNEFVQIAFAYKQTYFKHKGQ